MCPSPRLGLLCLLIGSALPASADMTLVEDFETPAVDGTVWCIQEFEGELVVGGLFDGLGRERIPTLAAWNGSDWRSLGLDQGNQHRIYCMTVFEGDLVVGSAMNPIDDDPLNYAGMVELYRVMRLTHRGWVQVGEPLRHQPRALTVHQGELFVGLQSSITTRGEIPLHRLVDGEWQPAGFPAGEVFISVHALVSDGETLFAGGSFEGPEPPDVAYPRGIYAWQAGAWNLVGDGLQSDRGPLSPSLPMGRQGVHDLALYQGELYATGSFVNEAEMYAGFARFDGVAWEPLPSIGIGYHITEVAEGLVVTGLIAHEVEGEHRYDLAAFDGTQWNDLDPGPALNPVVTAASIWQGSLVIARDGTLDMGFYGTDVPFGPGLAVRGATGWTSPLPGRAPSSPARALIEFEGDLVVGGSFNFAGLVPAAGVARLVDGDWVAFGDGLPGRVHDFADYRGALVAGGAFLAPGEEQESGVAFWNGEAWTSLSPDAGGGSIDGSVRCLAVYQDELWAGGWFRELNGSPASGLARFDGNDWHVVELDPAGSEVRAMAVYEGELLIGGSFEHIDGFAARGIVRFDGVQWREPRSSVRRPVLDLEVFDGTLYVSRVRSYSDSYYGNPQSLFAWDGVDSLQAVRPPDDAGYFDEWYAYAMEADANGLHLLTYNTDWRVPASYDLITWDGTRIVGRERWSLWGEDLRTWVPYELANVGDDLWIGGRWGSDADAAPRTLARLNTGTSVALPSIGLSARIGDAGIQLQWSLAHLPRLEGLVLEHSRDGGSWSTVWQGDADGWVHARPGAGVHLYRLIAQTTNGPVVSSEARVELSSPRTRIRSAAPNPFNPSTEVRFEVAESGPVSLRVYDIAGRLVRTLVDGPLDAGLHMRPWHGKDGRDRGVASGVYLIVLETGSSRDVQRVALVQ